MNKHSINVCIIYPADPIGVVPGGIDTFIRGMLRWAPDDFNMRLVGVTTNTRERPTRRWTLCSLGRREFSFYPLLEFHRPEQRHRIPLSLRFTFSLLIDRTHIDADVLEFHRIEPSLIFVGDPRPKSVFIHQNIAALTDRHSSVRWKYLPHIFYKMENFLLPRMNTIFTVREDAAKLYRERYPDLSERFRAIPTWMDPDIFCLPNKGERVQARKEINREYGFSSADLVLTSVGRLDSEKDPLLLLETFRVVLARNPRVRLLFIGDGVLRTKLEDLVHKYELKKYVAFGGLRPASEVARCLQATDLFVLSSAYEGMPMSVLEALGTGLPVVTTDVGEVRRVVYPGKNGEIAQRRDPIDLAIAIERCLANLHCYRGEPCTRCARDYTPEKVLEPVYESYRRLAAENRS